MQRSLSILLLSGIAVTLAVATALAAASDEGPVLRGAAAFGDWTKDAPGVRRMITVNDMPQPGESHSVANGPHVVAQPRGAWPKLPPGFSISVFIGQMKEPRQIRVAPNGDIFVAESGANRIRLIRADKDAPQANYTTVFVDGLDDRPYGIAFYPPGPSPQYIYIATEGQVLRYPYSNGDNKARGNPEVIVSSLPAGEHWTRDIQFTRDGSTMLVSVGAGSNDAENGMRAEKDRANILAFNPDGSNMGVYASGLRNPVSMAFHPTTGDLWVTVNERDEMGDNLPPDFVTRVSQGTFYGWPWFYIGNHEDPNYPGERPELRASVVTPDVLLQAHSAPLGLAIYDGKMFPAAYRGDVFVAMHGSWNRAKRTGYKIVRVRLDSRGRPTGEYDDFLTGFVAPDGNVWGRPVGLAVENDGALLMTDDASGTLWRIAYTAPD